jgi:hypothetical protein
LVKWSQWLNPMGSDVNNIAEYKSVQINAMQDDVYFSGVGAMNDLWMS